MGNSEETGYKEKRIRGITLIYYSRNDVKKALSQFSKNRECVPNYFQSFGKRPDSFQYESDIVEQVRRGATSFHCSEELWRDPLEISTDLSRDELDNMRLGWDLLLDIDSKYMEYSKTYTKLLIDVLNFYGVENIGIKFSGSKGFHVIIPWKAFPDELHGIKTKNMFPEWPRILCQFLSSIIQPKLADKLFKEESVRDIAKKTGSKEEDLIFTECLSCHRSAVKKYLVNWTCENCRRIGELTRIEKNKRIPKCPECGKPLIQKSKKEIFFCEFCNLDSNKNPEMFSKTREKTESLIDADLVLVAPRHLFRMPYSLHEKTALASIVIDKQEIENFQLTDASPLKVQIKNFYPEAKKHEAKNLLIEAIEWNYEKEKKEKEIDNKKEKFPIKIPHKKIIIPNPSEDIFPPQIKLILRGVKQDGRKRALFILLSFFKSLGMNDNEIEKKVNNWNEKNYRPLKKNYIISQLNWFRRNPKILPPNFDNPIYKELNVDRPDSLSKKTKNPLSYSIKKYFSMRR
ncbi:hypothetical protein GF386_00215 [Candidatus Pacearchaeota archaeon]|nr:hypothetical protein [Candidatus Pacearchaeota archaeon]MBD3282706.1 hypothetical protein [Candidatus Pacearchaeota archaeon]